MSALGTTARKSEKVMAKKRRVAPKDKKQKQGDTRILIVEARFYPDISDALLAGASRALTEAGAEFDCITVPGALEIPAAIAITLEAAERKRRPYDGVVALGCVIQGQTFHFDIVAMQSARALMDISVAQRLPVGNGILTVDNDEQARARADVAQGDKGGDAARAALTLIALKRMAAAR